MCPEANWGGEPDCGLFRLVEQRLCFGWPRSVFAPELREIWLDETRNDGSVGNGDQKSDREKDEGLCGDRGKVLVNQPYDHVVDQVYRVRISAESYRPGRIEMAEKRIAGEPDREIEDRHQG